MLRSPLLFPAIPTATNLVLVPDGERLPIIAWCGAGALPPDEVAAAVSAGLPLLVEHSRGSYRRPSLRGHRVAAGAEPVTGMDWSTAFTLTDVDVNADRLTITAADAGAGLELRSEVEALAGGALRIRHTVTNVGAGRYLLEGLDVSVPLPDSADEVLDFTGRHERERIPQRHAITDGLWLRENRRGRTGLESASLLAAGPAGFSFDAGEVLAAHVGFSGNTVLWAEREPNGPASIGGGEFLWPGEIALNTGESYTSPWVFVIAADDGLDGIAAALHSWQRTLPAHPSAQPVLLNVWEAIYFDHDPQRLAELAESAAKIGVERFVLDDGWFLGRRSDEAGLGDWEVDEAVWPDGLQPLIDQVHALGMEFGLWFEPEMVNPDSQLYRDHPDWILAAGARQPALSRHQLVLDLTNPQVWQYLRDRMDAILSDHEIDYVKWDHNRDLLEAGSAPGQAPAAHRQALAHYALLDELRARHPRVAWESCAAGGGRIDLGVLERVQRVWTSDMTDARARQQIQRWTVQFVAPEYLGAHVSAPISHQTGRSMSLDFRAATALFGAFGVEWDLTSASAAELERLAEWIARFKHYRPLLHSGRVTRIDSADPAVQLHGVVAADRRSALFAHVQLDESAANRGVTLRMRGLLPQLSYRLQWVGPVDQHQVSQAPAVDLRGPTHGVSVAGAVLARHGISIPRRRPETVLLIDVQAVSP